MTRAIVWKELREQGLIGLTLLVFGAGIISAAATFADPPVPGTGPSDIIRFLGAGVLATLLLAVTAGTVCGGALFAAEREAGTLGFLESLPVSRWQIWYAKLAAGALLVTVEVAVLLVVSATLGVIESLRSVLTIAVYSSMAFVWGLYGSTLARTTLGSVGVAVPSAAFASLFFLAPLSFLYLNPRTNDLHPNGIVLYLLLMFVTPLIGSAWRFTRQDRERTADDYSPNIPVPRSSEAAPAKNEPRRPRAAKIGFWAMLWLTVRQIRLSGLVMCGFAGVVGLSLLVDNLQLVLVWPALALTAGVLAGVTIFVDEQSHEIARFWGERRLPLWRLWLVKVAVHAGLAVMLALALLAPNIIRAAVANASVMRGPALYSVFRAPLFDTPHLGSQAWNLVVLPLVYGFVAGHLCGMLFRKAVVAAGVAGLVGGTAAAFWVPSLLSGGVHGWQLWLPPMVGMVTAYRLLRPWSADRLAMRGPLLHVGIGIGATCLVIGAGLAYRVLEIDDDPTSEDDVLYVAGLPPMDGNDSGRQMRSAAERFARAAQTASSSPDKPPPGSRPRDSVEERLVRVLQAGWLVRKDADSPPPTVDPELEFWLNKVYEGDRAAGDAEEPWFIQAQKAGADPVVGMYEHPLRAGTTASALAQSNGRRMGIVTLAHGLQKQFEGQPEQFILDLKTTLALGRTLRSGSVLSALNHGNDLARSSIASTNRWMQTGARAELLREAVRLIQEDDSQDEFDPRPHFLAERYVMRDLTKAPSQWLPALLTPHGRDREYSTPVVDLIGTAWNMPWERERTRRLLGIGFESGQRNVYNSRLIQGRPGWGLFTFRGQLTAAELIENDRQIRLHRRAIVLAIAIRLYKFEKGETPHTLNDLVVAGYLRAVPLDPYDGQPIRYRISAGERLTPPDVPALVTVQATNPGPGGPAPPPAPKGMPFMQPLNLAAGQPVLWSVGPDRTDEGGRNFATRYGAAAGGADIVFLVPLAEAKKP